MGAMMALLSNSWSDISQDWDTSPTPKQTSPIRPNLHTGWTTSNTNQTGPTTESTLSQEHYGFNS